MKLFRNDPLRATRRSAPRAVLAVALVVFGAAAAGCATGPSLPDSSSSVLSYGPVRFGNTDYRFTGSGFPIDDRIVVTTSHSCRLDRPTLLSFPGFLRSEEHSGRVVLRLGDITLIDLDGPFGSPAFRLAERGPAIGDRVTILDGSSVGHAAVVATAVGPDSLMVANWFQPLRKGSSGSPVVNGEGDVVGMVFANVTVGNRTLVSIYTAEEIHDALAALALDDTRPVARAPLPRSAGAR